MDVFMRFRKSYLEDKRAVHANLSWSRVFQQPASALYETKCHYQRDAAVHIWRHDKSFSRTAAHEFGHIIGFADQYKDVGEGSIAYPGHKENIMGKGDTVGGYHLRALAIKYK